MDYIQQQTYSSSRKIHIRRSSAKTSKFLFDKSFISTCRNRNKFYTLDSKDVSAVDRILVGDLIMFENTNFPFNHSSTTSAILFFPLYCLVHYYRFCFPQSQHYPAISLMNATLAIFNPLGKTLNVFLVSKKATC